MVRAMEIRRPGAMPRPRLRAGLGADALSLSAQAEVQSRLASASTSVKAQIASVTGVDVNNARVQQGAASALSLLQNGYNPDSTADSANLIHAIAGGMALIPGGIVFSAAIEALWQVGQVVACPLESAFESIGIGQRSPACGGAACSSSGGWTAAQILRANALPSMPTGSFRSLVFGALATYAAKALNCKGNVPPGMVVDACVAIWNQTHAGPSIPIWVPPLGAQLGGAGGAVFLLAGQGESISGTTPYALEHLDPNVYYAFQPAAVIASSGYAFPNPGGDSWYPFNVQGAPPGMQWTVPRVVSLNAGALASPARHTIPLHLGPAASVTAPAPSYLPTTTGGKIAAGTAVAVGGAFAAGSIFAFLKGQAVGHFWGKLWGKAWDEAKGLVGK